MIRNQMEKLHDHPPDYESIWQKIELETKRRQSGWNPQEKTAPYYGRRWKIAALGLIGAVGMGFATVQMNEMYSDTDTGLSSVPVVQQIGEQAEDGGVQYTIDTAAVEKTKNDMGYIHLNFNLSGIQRSDFDYANFNKSILTNLDSGKKSSIIANEFSADKGLKASASVPLDSLQPGEHHFRLQLRDLYLIRKDEFPIEGKVKSGNKYTLPVEPPLRIQVKKWDWSDSNRKLIFKYTMLPNTPDNNMIKLQSGTMDEASYVTVKWKEIKPDLRGMEARSDGITQEFRFAPMTDQQREQVRLSYVQGSIVQKMEGHWSIDFTIKVPPF
ncbi:hypothetical protein [Paenibacillus sp. Z6-24]